MKDLHGNWPFLEGLSHAFSRCGVQLLSSPSPDCSLRNPDQEDKTGEAAGLGLGSPLQLSSPSFFSSSST